MNNSYLKYSLLGSLFMCLLFLVSCEKEIVVDLNDSEPKIVIEAKIKLDSTATVKITKSKNYNTDGTFPAVNGAIVTISDNLGNSEILKQNASGLYYAQNTVGKEGRTYNLTVKVEDQTYTSTSIMPQYVAIDTLYMYDIPAFKYAVPMVGFNDPKGIDNYYRFVLYINGKHININFDITNDDNQDGFYIEKLLPVSKDDNGDKEIEKGDTIWIEMQCIDKGAYTFFESLTRISQSLTNPTSNIKGGALGYFSAYTYDRQSIIADWE